MDNELVLVWQVVNELSEQLAHNQKLTNALKSQAGLLKVCFRIVSPYMVTYLHFDRRSKLLKRPQVSRCAASMLTSQKVAHHEIYL